MAQEFICTFGSGQENSDGYVKVVAPTEKTAREMMYEVYGNKWSMIYSDEEAAGVQRFGLRLVATLS